MTGTVGENPDRLIAFIEAQGIEFAFTETIAPALGMSYDGKFAILSGAGGNCPGFPLSKSAH